MKLESGAINRDTGSSVHAWVTRSNGLAGSIARYADIHAPTLVRGGHAPSEIPICTVVAQLPLPVGFRVVPMGQGKVHVFDIYGTYAQSFDHSFAMNGTYVLCPSFGQFFDYQDRKENPVLPGARVALYKAKAPELVYELGPGIALLAGKQDDIFNRLGLVYENMK